MNNEQLRKVAPSIFAKTPWHATSEKYLFIPTTNVIEELRKNGLVPVRAMQSRTRIKGKGDFTRHMLRFRREQDLDTRKVGDEIPEVVLVNSHDASSSYKLSAGVFRLVCSNGMVVRSSSFGDVHVRHSGDVLTEVMQATQELVDGMPKVMQAVDAMKKVKLTERQRLSYANAAMHVRYPLTDDGKETSPIPFQSLLTLHRDADASLDLWHTFNVVQENFMRGGLSGKGSTGRRMTTRAINSVGGEMQLNKRLWELTDNIARKLAN